MLDWNSLPRPIVALAPMADMSDLPFCLICKEKGVPLMFREMVSAEAIVRLNPKTLKMATFDARERPLVQQIFGSNPAVMAEAAASSRSASPPMPSTSTWAAPCTTWSRTSTALR